jgi:hypothetical protein
MQLLCRSDAATAALADTAVIRYSFPDRVSEYETPQRPDRARSSKRSIKPPDYREHYLKAIVFENAKRALNFECVLPP